MEVDAATSDDSDATVAGEEDTPNAPDVPRFPPLDSSQLSAPIATTAHAQSHEAAAHLTQSSSRDSDGEDTGPVSPSLLGGYDASKGHEKNSDHDNMEIVPNSSGEGSTCDEEMSQEIPLQADMKCKATMNKTETRNPIQCHEDAQSLSNVIQDQEYLISYLSTLNKPSPVAVSEAKKKSTILEENLKVANLSNQAERKRLAAAHNSLLSQCLSQEELSQGSLPLKAQLLQLATRQKQLLECFKKQKEINSMLIRLEEASQSFSTGCSNPSQAPSTGVNRVDGVETKSSLSGGGVQVMKGKVTVPNPSTLAAALPNLVRHLQQPVTGDRGETRLQILPTVVASASNPSQTASSSTRNQLADVPIVSASQSRPSHTMRQLQTVLPSNSQSMTNKSSNVQVPSMNKLLISDSGGGGVAAAKAPLTSTDLSQPVPLPDLVKQGFIKPGVDCISCLIMGCEFKASLFEDGSIRDHLGAQHQHPQQWYRSCWAKLGHAQKKPTRKSAYTSVLYCGLPLLHFCEKYSLKQVNSYLIEKDKRKSLAHPTNDSAVLHTSTSCIQENDGMPQSTFCASVANMSNHHTTVITNDGTRSHPDSASNTVSVSGPLNWVLCSIDDILRNGRLLLHSSSKQTSLELPSGFWSRDKVNLSETLCQQIEQDLQW